MSRTLAGLPGSCRTRATSSSRVDDHVPWYGDTERVLAEIREFLTGTREAAEPDRVLATVLVTDVVGWTERAAALGDRRWRELLQAHNDTVARELTRFRGRQVD